jgi:hypothetical protein
VHINRHPDTDQTVSPLNFHPTAKAQLSGVQDIQVTGPVSSTEYLQIFTQEKNSYLSFHRIITEKHCWYIDLVHASHNSQARVNVERLTVLAK